MTERTEHGARRSLLRLSDGATRALRRVALVWAVLALAALVISFELGLPRFRPGGDAYVIPQQQAFGALFLGALVLAQRWEALGGTLAAVSAAAMAVFAVDQLQAPDAALVVAAFAVPGVLWILIELHDLRARMAALAIGTIAVAVVGGTLVAKDVYNGLYGPAHPQSATAALPDSPVQWMWVGGVTADRAVVTAKVDRGALLVRLVIEPTAGGAARRTVPPVRVDDHVARFEVDHLQPATAYRYAVELDGVVDDVRAGTFRTFPDGPASVTLAFGSCARVGSNGAVFDAIREVDPDLFMVTGDFHYSNIGVDDPGKFRDVLDLTLTRPAPAALYRTTPVAYVWDDHDYGANNADGTSPARPAAMQVYRQYVPHYPLAGADAAIYQAFTIGRVRVIITDTRSARSPASTPDGPGKTMLGAEQKAWLERELLAANDRYPVIIWVNPSPWVGPADPASDGWAGYAHERAELSELIAGHGIDDELVMVSGDAHMVAIDDGTNTNYSSMPGRSFPLIHAAALDRPGHTRGGPYSEGMIPGPGQFGIIEVHDDGTGDVSLDLIARNWENETLLSYSVQLPIEP